MDAVEGSSSPVSEFVERPFTSIDDLIWRVSWDARPSERGRLHAISAFLAPPAAVAAVLNARPGRVRAAVGNAIMSIITLDAVLVLAFCGERWAIVVLSLLGIFLFGRQIVPPT